MTTPRALESAETYLQKLKHRLDEIWNEFGDCLDREGMVYAKKHYGVMQREEIKDILGSLADLRERVDHLLADCSAIPADQRRSGHDSSLGAGEEDQLLS